MQKNIQQHERFLTEFGNLLTQQTNNRQPLQQNQAVANLADYIRAARRHHKLTRSILAHRTGKSEIEIFALEQGLLPYVEIDLPFLCRLAAVLGEEVETLVLLLGRPTFTAAANSTPSTDGSTSSRRTTVSQRFDNWLLTVQWLNPLYKRYLNLIDSLREGRLVYHTKTSYRIGVMLAVSVCLLLLWVSTYSLSGFFDAQSTVQSYATLPSKADIQHADVQAVATQPITVLSDIPSVSSKKAVTIAIPHENLAQMAKVATAPEDDEHSAAVLLLIVPAPTELQQCDSRTVGRFALCRV